MYEDKFSDRLQGYIESIFQKGALESPKRDLITKLILDNHFLSKGRFRPLLTDLGGRGRWLDGKYHLVSPDFPLSVFECESEFLFFALTCLDEWIFNIHLQLSGFMKNADAFLFEAPCINRSSCVLFALSR